MKTSYHFNDFKADLNAYDLHIKSKMGKLIIPKDGSYGRYEYNKIDVNPFLIKHNLINQAVANFLTDNKINFEIHKSKISRSYKNYRGSAKRAFADSYNYIQLKFNTYGNFEVCNLYIRVVQVANKKGTDVSIVISDRSNLEDGMILNIRRSNTEGIQVHEQSDGMIDLGRILNTVKYFWDQHKIYGEENVKTLRMSKLILPSYIKKAVDIFKETFKDIEEFDIELFNDSVRKTFFQYELLGMTFHFRESLFHDSNRFTSGESPYAEMFISKNYQNSSYGDVETTLSNTHYNIAKDLKNDMTIVKSLIMSFKLFIVAKKQIQNQKTK